MCSSSTQAFLTNRVRRVATDETKLTLDAWVVDWPGLPKGKGGHALTALDGALALQLQLAHVTTFSRAGHHRCVGIMLPASIILL